MTFTVYIKPQCPYSKNAIRLLKERKMKYTVHDINKYGGIEPVVKALKKNKFIPNRSRHNTVPIVFDSDDKFVGGYTELETYLAKH